MYNNCANLILRHFIKHGHGHQAEAPTQLFDGRTPIPAPLKQGDIDLITIGFPWYAVLFYIIKLDYLLNHLQPVSLWS